MFAVSCFHCLLVNSEYFNRIYKYTNEISYVLTEVIKGQVDPEEIWIYCHQMVYKF